MEAITKEKGEKTMKENMERFKMLLSNNEMSRVSVSADEGFYVDLHGMSCQQASRFLRNLIALVKTACEMTVIHGYNHGQALKDLVRKGGLSTRVVRTVKACLRF